MTVDEYKKRYAKAQGRRAGRAFEGFSKFNNNSTVEAFHEATQAAAKAAATAAKREGRRAPEWFEVSQVRILVGNPNVKVYHVVITGNP